MVLARSYQNLKLLLDLIPDRIFLLDKNGVIIDYQGPENPFYNMSKEEFIGKRYKDILPPKIVRQWDKTIKKAFLTQKIEKCRLHIPEKGEYKKFECRVNPKNVDYVAVILREIEAEDQPKMNEYLIKIADEASIIGYWDWDMKTGELRCSDQVYNIYGIDKNTSDRSYIPFWDRIPKQDKKNFVSKIQKSIESDQPFNMEHKINLPNGNEKIVYSHGWVFKDTNGEPIRIIGILHDVTEKKRLKNETLKQKLMLDVIMEGIADPIFIIDKEYNIIRLNNACVKYFKLNKIQKEKLGKCYHHLLKEKEVCQDCVVTKILSQGESYSIKRKRGDRIENVMFYPLFLKKGEIDGVMIFIKDITEGVEKERQMLQTDRMTTLGTLVSAVAHEINNPNNFIVLNIPIIKELWKEVIPILDKYQQEYEDFTLVGMSYREIRNEIPSIINYIEEGSKRIQKIVQNLKDYARIPSNEIDKKVNINDVLKNAIMLLGNQIKKATKHFIVNLKEDIPYVRGNFQNLEQVFINLIQNACQALTDPNQKIEVNSFYDKEKKNIIVKIKDEGIGISENLLPKIMEPFFTTKAKRGGTGLGLSVAKNIVQRHAGKIEVQSKYKEGSIFSVILPSYDAKKLKKILIIDDDKDIRYILRSAFESEGRYKVLEASSAIEASFILSQEMPDLIILDIMMPHINGVEVCRLLKDEERFRDIKVIIITGYPASKELAQVKEMGFKEIFEKPLSIKELIKRVEELIK